MRRMILPALLAAGFLAASPAARAGDGLPILAGRWSADGCARSAPTATRWFGPGTTATSNERCRLTTDRGAGTIYHAHLSCRYSAARPDTADVVLDVASATTVRWVDQCTATTYRFCGPGVPPGASPASR